MVALRLLSSLLLRLPFFSCDSSAVEHGKVEISAARRPSISAGWSQVDGSLGACRPCGLFVSFGSGFASTHGWQVV